MLSLLLNAPELESGDARVMQEIGNWELGNEVGNEGFPGRH